MKSTGITVTLALISFIAPADHRKDLLRARPCADMAIVAPNDPVQARQTVITFLVWYKTHIQVASRISLVNQKAGKPYSVNLPNGERYLAYLKSSHLLTDAYLNEWRIFFRQRNEGFQKIPQIEGPPTGFDYDLVLLTQDVDMMLASLKSLKIDTVTIVKNRATVTFTLFDAYQFRLIRSGNGWLINEILNISQE
ncbi:hypothetical protein [Spirosoma endophyticum]|nr:hypothetical protein [Spirosoma endophyticum]